MRLQYINWFRYPRMLLVYSIFYRHVHGIPIPRCLTFWYNYGSALALVLVLQLVTGVVSAMYYVASYGFRSLVLLMGHLNWGCMVRWLHMNGASWMFGCMYLHIGRNWLFESWHVRLGWYMGWLVLCVAFIVGFTGYVLPWGNMSLWAAKVITGLVGAVPFIGPKLCVWLWGGFGCSVYTVRLIFSVHFLFPFVLRGLVFAHFLALHVCGAAGPDRVYDAGGVRLPFGAEFEAKDCVVLVAVLSLLVLVSCWCAADAENFVTADPSASPAHIKPEWYFLAYYAMLRAVPDKLVGVLVMLGGVVRLLLLGACVSGVRGCLR